MQIRLRTSIHELFGYVLVKDISYACMYVYVCMHACMCMYACMHACMYVSIYVFMYVKGAYILPMHLGEPNCCGGVTLVLFLARLYSMV